MNIGKIITDRRKSLGLTQQALAEKLNISFQAVSKWENGTSYPDVTILPILAANLKVSIYCFSLPLLILYCKTKKDIKNRNIEQITIKNFKIEQDDTFGFKNRGGAAVGKRKYRIIDENGNYYLLSTANEKDMFFMFHINPSFSIEIEFLKTSRLVLHMKIIDEPQTNKKVRAKKYNAASDFRKIFGHYL